MELYKKFARKFYLQLEKTTTNEDGFYEIDHTAMRDLMVECGFKEESSNVYRKKLSKFFNDAIKEIVNHKRQDHSVFENFCLCAFLNSVEINFSDYFCKVFISICDKSEAKDMILEVIEAMEQFSESKVSSATSDFSVKLDVKEVKVRQLCNKEKELMFLYSITCENCENSLTIESSVTNILSSISIMVKDDKLRMLNKAIKLINSNLESLKIKYDKLDRPFDVLTKLSKRTTNDIYNMAILDNLVRMLKEYRKIIIELDSREPDFEYTLYSILSSTKIKMQIDINYIHIIAPYDSKSIVVTIDNENSELKI